MLVSYLDFVQVEKGGVGTPLYSVELAKAVSLRSQRSPRFQTGHVTKCGVLGSGISKASPLVMASDPIPTSPGKSACSGSPLSKSLPTM